MATFTGKTLAATYKRILTIATENITSGADAKYICDGDEGTVSCLSIGTERVGIGTTAPSERLMVQEDVVAGSINTKPLVRFKNGQGAGNFITLHFSGAASDGMVGFLDHGTAASRRLSFAASAASAEDMVISGEGKVGIGVTDPDEALEVDGHIHLAGRLDLRQESGDALCGQIGPNESIGIAGGETLDLDIKLVKGLNIGLASGVSYLYMASTTGFIGIKNSSPTYELDVAGDIGVDEYIYHNGDADTYMRFTDNQWLVRVNGDDRIVIPSSGNVGIGTATPSTMLEVTSTTNNNGENTIIRSEGDWNDTSVINGFGRTGGGFTARNLDSTANNYSGLYFQNASGYGDAGIQGIHVAHGDGDAAKGALAFCTRNIAEDYTERMRIDEDGNVGIGATIPLAKLHVGSNDNHVLADINGNNDPYIRLTSVSNAGEGATILYDITGEDLYIGVDYNSAADIVFKNAYMDTDIVANGTELMRIIHNGNVGIGVSDPDTLLEIKGANNSGLKITDSSSNIMALLRPDGDSSGGELQLHQASGGLKVEIKSDGVSYFDGGNVGIGETSPDELLHIKSASGDARILLEAPASSDAEIKFYEDSAVRYTIGYDDGTGNFVIGYDNVDTPWMSIGSTGNVGIGTILPREQLDITDDAGGTIILNRGPIAGGGAAVIDDEMLGSLEFGGYDDAQDGDWSPAAYIQAYADADWNGTNQNDAPTRMEFYTQSEGSTADLSSPRMAIDSTGKVGIGTTVSQGHLDLGSATAGNSLVWGGPTGVHHYATIGTAYSGADLTMGTGIKLNPAANQILHSYSGAIAVAGIRIDRNVGDIGFFNKASATFVKDALYDDATTAAGLDDLRMIIKVGGYVGIGIADPDGTLHVHTATAGSVTAPAAADDLVVENSADGGITILTPVGNTGRLVFGNDAISTAGAIRYNNSTDVMSFGTENSADAITILDSGNVGIGTTTPTRALDISGAAGGILNLHREDIEITDGEGLGAIYFSGRDGTAAGTSNLGAKIVAYCDEAAWDTDNYPYVAASQLQFFTQDDSSANTLSAPRMTIDKDGKVGIGTSAPSANFHVQGDVADDYSLVNFVYMTDDNAVDADDTILKLQFGDDNSEAGTPFYIHFSDSDSVCGSVTWSDDNTVAFNTSSDYRIKSNIERIDSSLANINKLKPSSFNIKERTKKAYGFIAHELEEIYPSMVTGEKDAIDKDGDMIVQQVAESKLIPFLVKAIQELTAKVEALENNNQTGDSSNGQEQDSSTNSGDSNSSTSSESGGEDSGGAEGSSSDSADASNGESEQSGLSSDDSDEGSGSSGSDSSDDSEAGSGGDDSEGSEGSGADGSDSVTPEGVPSNEWTKDELKAYMDANAIEYNSGDTKDDLLAKISAAGE